ncbi:MAG: M23 family metallopeptidase [Actinobacteria bacterium]|nr:M23 family metallopeptidase [Actinomycetota bacterium]
MALGVAAALLHPTGAAAAPAGEAGVRRRLLAAQRAMGPITVEHRRSYARILFLEDRIARVERRIARARTTAREAMRGADTVTRTWIAWGLADLLAGELAALSAHRRDRLALRALRREQREGLRVHMREAHRVIHDALARFGPAAWGRIWPVPVRSGGDLRACPVAGPWSLTDTYGAPRPGGRIHDGNDILAAWETPVIAAHDGLAVPVPNELGGRAVIVHGPGRLETYYAHLTAYGRTGPVRAGDVIGYVGNSGNARGRIHHLHFEWRPAGDDGIDPFRRLIELCGPSRG